MVAKYKIIISFMIPSILFICASLPLIMNKIAPNNFYGFRSPKILSDKETWYKANNYGGRCFLMAGSITFMGCLWLLLNQERFSSDTINSIGFGLFVVPALGALILSLSYIKKL